MTTKFSTMLLLIVVCVIRIDVTAFGAINIISLAGQITSDGLNEIRAHSYVGLNDSGHVSYTAGLGEIGSPDAISSVIYADGISLVEIVREGESAPDGNGTFRSFARPKMDSTGRIVFESSLDDTAGGFSDDYGIFLVDGTNTVQVIHDGYATPSGLHSYTRARAPTFSQSGDFAVQSPLNGFFLYGIYRSDGLTVSEIARGDLQTPNSTDSFGFVTHPKMSDAGQIAFLSYSFDSFGMNEGPYRYIFVDSGAGPVEIVREGDPDPDEADVLYGLTGVEINNVGDIAFTSQLVANPSQGFEEGLFIWEDGIISSVARPGSSINGTTDTIRTASGLVGINNQKDALFYARTIDNLDPTLFLSSSGGLDRVVAVGDEAPGNLGESPTFANVYSPTLDESSRIYFSARLQNTLGGIADDKALYKYEDGQITEIVREGDTIAGKTIASLDGVSATSTPDFLLNAMGQIAFGFTLVDGRDGIAIYSEGSEFAADLDHNGLVDSEDFDTWQLAFGNSAVGDTDDDNDSDGKDFLNWQRQFGSGLPIPGDFDIDGGVDKNDFRLWQSAFGVTDIGDADRDSDTDGIDFLKWQRRFENNENPQFASAITPEPSSVLLWMCAILIVSAQRYPAFAQF